MLLNFLNVGPYTNIRFPMFAEALFDFGVTLEPRCCGIARRFQDLECIFFGISSMVGARLLLALGIGLHAVAAALQSKMGTRKRLILKCFVMMLG